MGESTEQKTLSFLTTWSQGKGESSLPAQFPMNMILDLEVLLRMAPDWD